jgi:tripartite-type tricarboxylate transporter receptor subunit TctC
MKIQNDPPGWNTPVTRRMASRRSLLAASLAAPALGAFGLRDAAHAQAGFPNKPIRIIVNNAPGGVGDLVVRLTAQKLSKAVGQPVVVDNRAGAGGILAGNQLMASAPDGYTLMTSGNATAIRPSLFKSYPFDIQKDFASVTTLAFFPIAIVVAASSPLRTAADFLRQARQDGGNMNIGTIAVGSTQFLAAEMFKSLAGSPATTVPFNSTPQLINALLRGDVQVGFETLGPLWSQMQGGELRVLAVTQAKRVVNLPDVPTLIESGLPDFDVASWNSLVAPAGTPIEIRQRLSREVNAILRMPDVVKILLEAGVEPRGSTPEELDALTAKEMERWRVVIEKAGIEKQ